MVRLISHGQSEFSAASFQLMSDCGNDKEIL